MLNVYTVKLHTVKCVLVGEIMPMCVLEAYFQQGYVMLVSLLTAIH